MIVKAHEVLIRKNEAIEVTPNSWSIQLLGDFLCQNLMDIPINPQLHRHYDASCNLTFFHVTKNIVNVFEFFLFYYSFYFATSSKF